MSAATLMQVWGEALLATGLLVLAVLFVRKPFARHFGPQLTYCLWLIPALRLVLPPLPFASSVPAAAPTLGAEAVLWVSAESVAAVPAAPTWPAWSLADAMPILFALWAAGMVVVLIRALVGHRRFRAAVLADAVELEPVGGIRLVMSGALEGPVAFGLIRRYVAIPRDFFARYAADERALAIDHELSHHRHGDLWANAAALLLLASQWFNPLAWRAVRAFRFDQEAACDARVLTMAGRNARHARTAHYATAIAKAAIGSRLSLAAPMAIHDNLQERLTMLMRQDISRQRDLIGRLLVGGAALGVLAATATLVPSGIASAQPSVQSEPSAPPAPPALDAATDGASVRRVAVVTTTGDEDAASEGGIKREERRIVIRDGGDGEGQARTTIFAPSEGDASGTRRIELALPGSLSRDDILATLKEQGITGKKADAIADKLDAKRKQGFRTALAPLPPLPPIPPAAWAPVDGRAMALAHCGDGKTAVPLFDRAEQDGGKRRQMVMMACGDGAQGAAVRLSALKKARDRLATGDGSDHISADMRAKIVADMDRAIAEVEKAGD
jgi:bla regulator protein BlaR1